MGRALVGNTPGSKKVLAMLKGVPSHSLEEGFRSGGRGASLALSLAGEHTGRYDLGMNLVDPEG